MTTRLVARPERDPVGDESESGTRELRVAPDVDVLEFDRETATRADPAAPTPSAVRGTARPRAMADADGDRSGSVRRLTATGGEDDRLNAVAVGCCDVLATSVFFTATLLVLKLLAGTAVHPWPHLPKPTAAYPLNPSGHQLT